MPEPHEIPGVLQELRRRRVNRVAVMYWSGVFAVLESTRVLLPLFGNPEGGFRAVLAVFVLGFPLTIVLAWTYDVDAGRIVRTPDDESSQETLVGASGSGWIIWSVAAVTVGVILEIFGPR